MSERMFGMETEYGLTVIPAAEERLSAENVAGELVGLARKHPHLPGLRSSGIFLPNGSRFYVDCGHPELCTPECSNPWDACRYIRAGEQLLLSLAGQLTHRERGIERTLILRNNVDYVSRSTWGCHESYLHTAMDRGALSREIIPHLVSRLIFCGAGGFDCYSPGVAFRISPRVSHLQAAISGDSTGGGGGRPIFHTRDEPLCSRGYQRMHILCGESLCGETGTWLKIGTTALVLALIEAGKRPGAGVDLRDPLEAMRIFAGDPACQRSVKLADESQVTALDIQDHFLRQAEAHAEASFMPSWAGEVCQRWRAMLDCLRAGAPASPARTLDWAIKLALFESHVRRRGATFETLADWTRILDELRASLVDTDYCEQPITAELALASRSPLSSAKKRLTPFLRERGLAWEGLPDFLALRLELFEIDTRYSILGEGGIFASLNRSGVLDHSISGVDNISHALEHAPAAGRAALRGACIRRVAGHNGRFACEWDGVFDLKTGKRLDLTDPFCVSENWEAHPNQPEPRTPDMEALFRSGRYADVLQRAPESPHRSASEIECIALSYGRLGRHPEALEILGAQRQQFGEFHFVALSMSVLSNGFVPDVGQLAPLVAAGDQLLGQAESGNAYSRFIFLLYKGLFFMQRGSYPLAEALFMALLADPSNAGRTRMLARTRCYLAELHRRLGRREAALQMAGDASRTHHAEPLTGDLADHSLPMLAKLSPDDVEADELFEEAEEMQRAHGNHLGVARILCLRARRLKSPHDRQEIELIQRTVPALAKCEVARKIVREWLAWIAPRPASEPMDYWGL